MEVTFIDERNKVDFKTLTPGDTFIDPEYDETTIFVVIEETFDTRISSDLEDVTFDGYAAALNECGKVYGYQAEEKIIPVSLEVIVKLK